MSWVSGVLLLVMFAFLVPLLANLRTTDRRRNARALMWGIIGCTIGGLGNIAFMYLRDGSWWWLVPGSALTLLLGLSAVRTARALLVPPSGNQLERASDDRVSVTQNAFEEKAIIALCGVLLACMLGLFVVATIVNSAATP